MATDDAESSLARHLAEHYPRARHEARSLLHEAFATPVDLQIIHGRLQVIVNRCPPPALATSPHCADSSPTPELPWPGTNHTLVSTISNPTNPA